MDILKAENITFGYKKNVNIIEDINFQMDNNSIVGLFGDSGSGKTTFGKIITNFIDNYTGSVTVNGEEISSKEFNPVQLIYQHPEKVMNPRWNMGKILTESWNPPQDVLDEFGIKKEWLKRYPSELSGGELQRFSILRSLNPKTKFIVADEITTMLDAITQAQIWTSVINHCRKNNVGILAVSHDMNLLERICDDIIYFNELNHKK
ncbi:MAG: ATP-binding cassette domain-containing protein [Methanosphaera sp.]|uniref:ATP-binding cassette domain-containing protein n=1 Tax=Methanosphaera sp. TaxID=2666342 RepID=UPI0025E6CEC7|nr:ATP-binding cassette domain-containing protein [Methanosphaera sp.]MCI5867479.1 ATP-binding cassette domain-containing protein [Methanosphaera sp.]MDD6534453.1 ATP-binding cassette domain-containing protein [Methanosphaera sp.]MDY3955878.1 ATP-binding cassette domain-containing protein [Methanosphaera sp.]